MFDRLIVIPDYLTLAESRATEDGHPIVACKSKFPKCHYDAENADHRRDLMARLMDYTDMTVLTPSAGYLSRLCAHDDRCFFVDLTLRMIAAGAGVTINTNMRRDALTEKIGQWLDAVREFGVEVTYLDKPDTAAPDKDLILAEDVLNCYHAGMRELVCAANAIITPYARDEARDRGVTIRKRSV